MKTIILTLLITVLLTSCAVQVKSVALKRRIYEDVPLNTVLKNEIGDRLITVGEEDYQDALKIIETPDFKINTMVFPYKKGDVLPLSGSTNEWYLYFLNNSKTNNSNYFGIAVNIKNNSIIMPFVYNAPPNGWGFITKETTGFKTKSDIYTENNCSDCFKQEFIFNGKVGSSLKFIYREYINDMARPAFKQDLQYDLNESNIVGFKGLRLEIIKTTNTSVEYKILSSFNKMK